MAFSEGRTGQVVLQPSSGKKLRGLASGIDSVHVELPDDPEMRSALLAARRTGEVGLVHSWELVTAVDGPGTRMTLFLAGCPLRCQYCHNPDTMNLRVGTLERADAVVKKIARYKTVFRTSGGGLTISGGEPLFQIAFTRRIIGAVHQKGIHVAVDTSGYLGARLTDDDLANIDLFLLDVKSGDEETYQKVTGRPLAPTIAFGDRLSRANKPVWVRFVLVPGLTDAPENVSRVADIVARWKNNVERVEVLPFHNMAADKWKELDMHYTLEGVKPPTLKATEAVRDEFRSRGLTVF